MKNRNIPFGYRYENGCIVLVENESAIVKEICEAYIAGSSMLEIANKLHSRKIEYMPGVTGWNKARIKRIVEDERYLGMDCYPAIIGRDIFNTIQEIKTSRNTQRDTERKNAIYQLAAPVLCAACGSEMKRRVDNRRAVHQRWACINPECKILAEKRDEDLVSDITALINQLIAEPSMVCIAEAAPEPSLELRKAESEIGRMLDTVGFDRDVVREKIFECVSLKYRDIDSKPYIAKRLRADFERSGLLSDFSAELFRRTVKSIQLEADGAVSIILLNDQKIGKESSHDSDRAAVESGACYTADR